jgi:hypothetical protein
MSTRRQDWTITVEYIGADFTKNLPPKSHDQPRHAVVQRGRNHSLLIFLNEFDTTVGEALRRLPRHLNEVEKMLIPPAEPAAIEIGLYGHSRPEDLVSLSEIAELLQVSRQRAQQLSKQAGFPRPKGTPRNGPVYLLADAERYRAERAERIRDRRR